MDSTLEGGLAAIAADREHGAAHIAIDGLWLLGAVCEAALMRDGAGAVRAACTDAVRALATVRPSMAPVGNAALLFYDAFTEQMAAAGGDGAPWRELPAQIEEQLRDAADALVESARPVLGDAQHILTLSHSATVDRVLLEAAPRARVTVAESRPGFEGRRVVEILQGAGREVRIITDAAMALAMAECDLVLLGADSITAGGAAVNKTGSRLAALAAAERERPCFVAADLSKINPRVTAQTVALETMEPEEVWLERPEVCANVYFEPVPASLITGFITEKGSLSPRELEPEIAAWRARYEAAGLLGP